MLQIAVIQNTPSAFFFSVLFRESFRQGQKTVQRVCRHGKIRQRFLRRNGKSVFPLIHLHLHDSLFKILYSLFQFLIRTIPDAGEFGRFGKRLANIFPPLLLFQQPELFHIALKRFQIRCKPIGLCDGIDRAAHRLYRAVQKRVEFRDQVFSPDGLSRIGTVFGVQGFMKLLDSLFWVLIALQGRIGIQDQLRQTTVIPSVSEHIQGGSDLRFFPYAAVRILQHLLHGAFAIYDCFLLVTQAKIAGNVQKMCIFP